jgi:pimeloyl-ACP methyl ester carboxylesterase
VPALVGAGYTVHALDLLGLGFSDKPADVTYSIDLWASQVVDYIEGLSEDVVLVGNSFGSLISLEATAKAVEKVKGIVMLNCGVGMNNKNVAKSLKFNDFQKFLIGLVLGAVDALLKSPLLDWIFSNFATAETVGAVLKDLYLHDPSAVDDEIVEAFVAPGKTAGSVGVLRQIYTGAPGRTPMEVFENPCFDTLPMKVIWGEKDNLTPIDGDVGSFLSDLSQRRADVDFETISAGHIPHDDNPRVVNDSMVGWLRAEPWLAKV